LYGEKFTLLRDFAAGFASVFPPIATVDSDFSVFKWEENKFRSALTDISLEGILHYRQYEALRHKTEYSRLAI
jgi:hypothetical protein